jgi:NADH-quinone oxidoreductase subunit A
LRKVLFVTIKRSSRAGTSRSASNNGDTYLSIPVNQSINLLPFLVYIGGVLFIVAAMYLGSYVLGQRHKDKETDSPYESGIKPTGSARTTLSVKFYLVAMLFVIFDLEVVFLFSWAVAARQLGWSGYWGMLIFVAILVAGLIFEWRMGALDWLPYKGKFTRRQKEVGVGNTEQAIK